EWIPPVVKTTASKNIGIDDVLREIEKHRNYLESTGHLISRRKERERERVRELVEAMLRFDFWTHERTEMLETELDRIVAHERTSFDLAHELIGKLKV
ncbi:MAG TPA: hypothetical protein VFX22_06450, partial [Candidatus Kapabacteria bacterium]|nr:hypothetical protein [Candidatus Kapabacteria bacterium]